MKVEHFYLVERADDGTVIVRAPSLERMFERWDDFIHPPEPGESRWLHETFDTEQVTQPGDLQPRAPITFEWLDAPPEGWE